MSAPPALLTSLPSGHARPRAARLATCALFSANGIVFGTWVGALPRLREVADLNDQALGFVLLAVSVGATAAMPLIGRVAARAGAARTCLVAAIGLALALPLIGLAAGSYPVLLACSALLGVLLGTLDVGMNAHAARVERHWGAAIMSSFHGVWSVSGLAGAALLGLLLARGWGLQACYAVGGGVCFALGLAAVLAERGLMPEAPLAPPHERRFRLPSGPLVGVCCMAALSYTMEGGISEWSGVYLRVVLRSSAAGATVAYQAFAMAMALCRFGGDVVVRRLGRVAVVRLGGLLAICGVAAGLLVAAPVAAATCFALAGAGLANVVPVVFSAAGRHGGTAGVAMAATTGYVGLLAGPPIIGFVAQHLGLADALALLAAGALPLIVVARAAA